MNNRQVWLLVGGIAVVAVVTGLFVRNKTGQTDSEAAANSQLPATEAEANYNVPPDIGASVDAGWNVSAPPGSNVTYTPSQANSLPTA